jgi:3-oxoacyl-[acyl-carrier-protein] synthase II
MKRRVVVTGIGVVAPNGIGKEKFWEAIKNGQSGISKISSFDISNYPVKIAGEVKNFNPKDYLDEKTISRTAKFGQFALAATKEAAFDAQLKMGSYNPERMGVALGTAMGGLDFALDQHITFMKNGPLSIDSFTTSIVVPSAATRAISLALQAKGPCMTFCSSCAAAADAIGFGLNSIRNNETDIMIVGGAESPLNPAIFGGFCLARVLSIQSEQTPRPFDLNRDGTVIGEGSGILIIEELEHAKKRNAQIHAEIIGYGSTCDSYHIVNPDPEGTQGIRAIELALRDGNIRPEEVSYINAHGTATIKNDQIEVLILKNIFGENLRKIPVSSTKSMTGHLLGASGAIEAIICILAIKDDVIPPTINYKNPDPQCDLDFVPNNSRKKQTNIALSNSFGFGGFNAVLILKKGGGSD